MTTKDIKDMKPEDIFKNINFIQSSERLIGENEKGVTPVMSRPLKDFIRLNSIQLSSLATSIINIGGNEDITQKRVNELFNVECVNCP